MRLPLIRTMMLAASVLVAPALAASPSAAVEPHTSREVLEAKEAALPPGVLPAWQTTEELERSGRMERQRLAPWVSRIDDGPLPPPPGPGYRVPAEFEPVSAFLVSRGDWGTWGANPSINMLYAMIREGTGDGGAGALVLVESNPSAMENQLLDQGVDPGRFRVLLKSTGLNAKWSRDFGPIGIYEGDQFGHLAFVDMHYYNTRPADDLVPSWMATQMGLNRYGLRGTSHTPPDDVRLYMEGGNYQIDGNGTCILSNDIPADNSGNTDANTFPKVEQILAAYLGCEQIIWLTPPPNTGTGHVDMYAKLLSPTDILVIEFPGQSANDNNANNVIANNVTILDNSVNLDGDSFVVHRVMLPSLGSGWTYRTYTNSVIVNDRVLVPTYGYPTQDANALTVYENILGDGYTVIGIDSSSIVAQGGAVHCTTMQIPSACGNGVIDELLFEECDGGDLGGATCESLGYDPGQLGCDTSCRYDISACGNGSGDADSDSDSDGDGDGDSDGDADGDEDPTAFSPDSSGCGCGIPVRWRRSIVFALLGLL